MDLFSPPLVYCTGNFPDKIQKSTGERAIYPTIPRLVLPKSKRFHSKEKLKEITKIAIKQGIFTFYEKRAMPVLYRTWTDIHRALVPTLLSYAVEVPALMLYTVRRRLLWCYLYTIAIDETEEYKENLLRLLEGTKAQKMLGRGFLSQKPPLQKYENHIPYWKTIRHENH